MPADLAHYAAPVLALLATYLLHSTCLLAGVGLYFCCHRTAGPALRSGLWKLAATAGFLTAPLALYAVTAPPVDDAISSVATQEPTPDHPSIFIASPMDVPSMESSAAVELFDAGDAVDLSAPIDEWPVADELDDIGIRQGNMAAEIAAPVSAEPVARPRDAARMPLHWEPKIVVGASAVATLFLLWGLSRLCGQSMWLRRRFDDCRPLLSGPAAEELAELVRQQRTRVRVQLLSSAHYSEPAAFGLWRWQIVLPDRAEAELSRAELRSLLAHELAHLVRRDIWWLCIGRLLCTAFAYQPLNFWARRQWQRAAEFLCDEWAVSRTGDRFALANCLTTVAGWRIGTNSWSASLAATGHRSSLSERVEHLVDNSSDDSPASRLSSLSLSLVALAVVIGLITNGPTATFALPTAELPSIEPATQFADRDAAAELEMNADVEFTEVPLIEPAQTDVEALRSELAALHRELDDFQRLLAQTSAHSRLKQYPARIRRRIAGLETQLDEIEHPTSNTPPAPGSAGGANHNRQSHPTPETNSNPLAHVEIEETNP